MIDHLSQSSPEAARKQLELLGYQPDDRVFLRFISLDKTAQNVEFVFPNIPSLPFNKGSYVVVNGGGHSDIDINCGRAVFYEHDDRPKEKQKDLWKDLKLPEPTLQVDTGGKSIHSYWVFDAPIPIAEWLSLQKDLLDYSKGDQKIKNASRVMRLAGSIHQKTGETAMLISEVGSRYSFEEMREAVPVQQKSQPPRQPSTPSIPAQISSDLFPLEIAIAPANRALISQGSSEGSRDNSGAALARDLIGTANYLTRQSHSFTGDPLSLFNQYCQRCSPPLTDRDCDRIFRSAEKSNPTSSLDPEKIENCIAAWKKKQGGQANPLNVVELRPYEGNEKTDGEKLRRQIKKYIELDDIFEKEPLKNEICSNFRISIASFNTLVNEIEGVNEKREFKIYEPEEFMQLASGGIRWLVPGLIPSVGVTLFGGDPGAGKTTLAYDLAASIIYGEEYLGETPTKTGKVLIISTDEPFHFAQDKLVNRGIADGYEIACDWDVTQFKELEQALENTKPLLIIVDSFASIHNATEFDENSSVAGRTARKLEKLSSKFDCAIVLIHHLTTSKDAKGINKVRGSSAIAAAVSAVCLFEGEGTTKRLYYPKLRGAEPPNLVVEMDAENGRFKVISGNFVDDTSKSIGDRLMAFFSQREGTFFELSEIHPFFSDCDHESVAKALRRLVKKGTVSRRQSNTNWRQKVWGLSLSPRRSNVSGDNSKTFTEKEFPSPDISPDNHQTSPDNHQTSPDKKKVSGDGKPCTEAVSITGHFESWKEGESPLAEKFAHEKSEEVIYSDEF